MIAALLRSLKPVAMAAAIAVMVANAHASDVVRQPSPKDPAPQETVVDREPVPGSDLQNALAAYDRAFQERDVTALARILGEDVVLYEQGTQNIGRDDVLTNHLGPELRGFQELSASYGDVSVREAGSMAMVTRLFSIKGKRQGRLFSIRGSETQGWVLRQGRWELVHIHLSFPSR